jgi:hypothetical protein
MTATHQLLLDEVKDYIDHADVKTLRNVKAILVIEQETDSAELEEENWDDLPEELRMSIDQGIKEGEEGKTISYEQFKKENSKWFKK